jgi:hypothetical protein
MVAPYPIPRRCTATYYPEGNVLIPLESVAEKSNTPTSKSVQITIAPSARQATFDWTGAVKELAGEAEPAPSR